MQLEHDDTVFDPHDLHVAAVRMEVRPDLGEGGLHRRARLFGVAGAEPVRGQQLPCDRVGGRRLDENVAPPVPDHLDQAPDPVRVEHVDPIEQLLCERCGRRIVMSDERFGQF